MKFIMRYFGFFIIFGFLLLGPILSCVEKDLDSPEQEIKDSSLLKDEVLTRETVSRAALHRITIQRGYVVDVCYQIVNSGLSCKFGGGQ